MKLFAMKNIGFFTLALMLWCAMTAQAQDTLKVELGGNKIIIIAKDKDGLKNLSQVDLNKIVAEAIKKADSTRTNDKTKTTEPTVIVYQPNDDFNNYYESEYGKRDLRKRRYRRGRSYVRNYFAVDLGFNNYLENGSFPDETGKNYGLGAFGARYISVGWYRRTSFFRSPLYLTVGLEVSWNNYMFQNNTYITQDSTGVQFRDYAANNAGATLDKSKLTAIYANIPLLLGFKFRNEYGRTTFRFDVGGYVGYRLDSYAKIKPSGAGTQRPHNKYYLNNVRYGLMTHLGFRGFLLFAKYDMNNLFVTDKGPELNSFSFGVRF